jgi:hypothetical protein
MDDEYKQEDTNMADCDEKDEEDFASDDNSDPKRAFCSPEFKSLAIEVIVDETTTAEPVVPMNDDSENNTKVQRADDP